MQYKSLYEQMHREKMFDSKPSLTLEDCKIINVLTQATGAQTVLDFGSGTGTQYTKLKMHKAFGILTKNITCYDPAVPEYSIKPEEVFDGVISTDVLEHIPEEELPEALEFIFSKATKFVYLVIFCGLAIKTLPDGSNAHCTVKPPKWWKDYITLYNIKGLPMYIAYRVPFDASKDILNLGKR